MQNSLTLLDARKRLGLTQTQLANLLEITAEYVSMIENGKKTASQKILNKLNLLLNQMPRNTASWRAAQVMERLESVEPRRACQACVEKDKEIMWLRDQLAKCQDNLAAALAVNDSQTTQSRR